MSVNLYDDRLEIVSPGAMMSGERLNGAINKYIPSVCRNPFLADVFARMNFMERRGSGLKKITDRTNALFAYNKNHVKFFSDNMFFTTVIYNANYDADTTDNVNVVESVVESVVEKLSNTERQVLEILRINSLMSAEQLAAKIGKTQRTVQRALASLKTKGYIERIGADSRGEWKVIKK